MIDTVYFYEVNSLIKVGYSCNLRDRPHHLSKGGQYVGAMLGGREMERTFKMEFAAFRAEGEYFHDDPIIRSTIMRVLTKFGILGNDCIRLTDPDVPPSERVSMRDGAIKAQCVEIVHRNVTQLALKLDVSLAKALHLLSVDSGVRPTVVRRLRYDSENLCLTPAEAEAILAIGKADSMDREKLGPLNGDDE